LHHLLKKPNSSGSLHKTSQNQPNINFEIFEQV